MKPKSRTQSLMVSAPSMEEIAEFKPTRTEPSFRRVKIRDSIKRTLFGVLAFLLFLPLPAQNISLNKEDWDDDYLKKWDNISWNLRDTMDGDSSARIAHHLMKVTEHLNSTYGRQYVPATLAHSHEKKERYDSAKYYYNLALEAREGDSSKMAKMWLNLGWMDYRLKNKIEGIRQLSEARSFFLSREAYGNVAATDFRLATIMDESGIYGLAGFYFEEQLEMALLSENQNRILDAYLGLANYHESLKQYRKAIDFANKVLELAKQKDQTRFRERAYQALGNNYSSLGNLPEAEVWYLKALEMARAAKEENDIADIQLNLAKDYLILNRAADYRNAIEEAMTYYKKNEKAKNLGAAYVEFAKFEFEQENYLAGKQYGWKADSIFQLLDLSDQRKDLYQTLSDGFAAVGDLENALTYSQKLLQLKDSLQQEMISADNYSDSLRQIRSDQLLYEEQVESKRTFMQAVILSLIVVLILGTLLGFYYARSLQHRNQLLVQDQRIDSMLKESETLSLQAKITGQEQERHRIAEKLHDSLGSLLSTIKLHFKSVDESLDKLKEENRAKYQLANDLLDRAVHEVRSISHEMTHGLLERYGLKAALQEMIRPINESQQIKCELLFHGLDERIGLAHELPLYRTVQELVGNAMKHSNAGHLTIQLILREDGLNITVEDDGRGFDPNDKQYREGLGLASIRDRVKALHGKLNIDSKPGSGTTIDIDIPL